jgi:hypothetical protein
MAEKKKYYSEVIKQCDWGAFNQDEDRILPFFIPLPPPSLHGQFLYPEFGQK